MRLNSVEIEDTFAEAFQMIASRLLITAVNEKWALKAASGVIMPFPGGIVRSGSKTTSRYRFLKASTNTAYCPTIKRLVDSQLPEEVNSVLEIVIDGLSEDAIREAMRVGLQAACIPGILKISAGNYGGTLGKYQFHLHEVLNGL